MPETAERSQSLVVFHYPPGSIPDEQLANNPIGLTNIEYYSANADNGDVALVSPIADLRSVLKKVMDDTESIPAPIGVAIVPSTSVEGDTVHLGSAIYAKGAGQTVANGTYETLLEMAETPDTFEGIEATPAEEESDEGAVESSIRPNWFDPEPSEEAEADQEVVDSAEESYDAAVSDPQEDPHEVHSNADVDDADTGNSEDEEREEGSLSDPKEDEEEVPQDSRLLVVQHLVNRVVPSGVDGSVSAPIGLPVDDLDRYPAQVRVLVDTLVRQANVMMTHTCAEAQADVGYLSDNDVQDEKQRLIESLLADPTDTVRDYITAITHRDQLIDTIENDLKTVSAEFQRREDDWVEEKLRVVIPELRELFRKSYPTTEEKVSQEVMDNARPDLDLADQQVEESELRARNDVALRLRHQSTTGRHISQLMRL